MALAGNGFDGAVTVTLEPSKEKQVNWMMTLNELIEVQTNHKPYGPQSW